MESRVITRINGVDILASNVSEQLIPIKPICEALGVAHEVQFRKLKEHPIFSSAITTMVTVASDNKEREMLCIPIQFLSGWIFSINPANVKEEAKEGLIKYQLECNKALFNYFFGSQQRQLEQNKVELSLLEEISEIKQSIQADKAKLSEKQKMLERLREERLRNEPLLF